MAAENWLVRSADRWRLSKQCDQLFFICKWNKIRKSLITHSLISFYSCRLWMKINETYSMVLRSFKNVSFSLSRCHSCQSTTLYHHLLSPCRPYLHWLRASEIVLSFIAQPISVLFLTKLHYICLRDTLVLLFLLILLWPFSYQGQ